MCNIEKKRLIKEVNRSLSKAMYIYLKLLLRRSQNFDFLGLKNSLPGQFIWGAPTHANVFEFQTVWLFYYFNFERNYDNLKTKRPCILLKKNINFKIITKWNRKLKIPLTFFREMNLVLQLM